LLLRRRNNRLRRNNRHPNQTKFFGQERREKRFLNALGIDGFFHHQVHLHTELSRQDERVVALEAL
jgi:hypothetical protein